MDKLFAQRQWSSWREAGTFFSTFAAGTEEESLTPYERSLIQASFECDCLNGSEGPTSRRAALDELVRRGLMDWVRIDSEHWYFPTAAGQRALEAAQG